MSRFGTATQKASTSTFAAPSAKQDNPLFQAPEGKAANPFFQEPTNVNDQPLFSTPSSVENHGRFGQPSDPGNTSLFGQPSDPGPQSRFGQPSDDEEQPSVTLDFSDLVEWGGGWSYTEDGILVLSEGDVSVVGPEDLTDDPAQPLLTGSDAPFALISSFHWGRREMSEGPDSPFENSSGDLEIPEEGFFNTSAFAVLVASDNNPQHISFDWNFLTVEQEASCPELEGLKTGPETPTVRDQAFVAFVTGSGEEQIVFQRLTDATDLDAGHPTGWQRGNAEVSLLADMPFFSQMLEGDVSTALIYFGILDVDDGHTSYLGIDNVTFENLDLMGLSNMPDPVL